MVAAQSEAVVRAAVAQNGYALEYAAAELKADKEIVATAVAQNGHALYYAAAELKRDPALLQLQALNPQVSAPLLAARFASAGSMTPLRISFPPQRSLIHATSSQLSLGSNCWAVHDINDLMSVRPST